MQKKILALLLMVVLCVSSAMTSTAAEKTNINPYLKDEPDLHEYRDKRPESVDDNYAGLISDQYGWWYIKDGKYMTDYTGIYSWKNVRYYIEDGRVRWLYTGFYQDENDIWYITNGINDPTFTKIVQD